MNNRFLTDRRDKGHLMVLAYVSKANRVIGRRRFVALAAATLTGCRGIEAERRLARPPDLVLETLELEPGDRGGAVARAVIGIHNPNAWRIAIDAVTCDVVLNGTLLGRVTRGRDRFVAAGGNGTLTLELPFRPTPATAALLTREPPPRGVGYRLSGTLKLVGRGVDLMPFALEGRWPLA